MVKARYNKPFRNLPEDQDHAFEVCADPAYPGPCSFLIGKLDSTRFQSWDKLRLNNVVQIPYDVLIVAVGAVNNTFHTPGVREHAFFLKEVRCTAMSCILAALLTVCLAERSARSSLCRPETRPCYATASTSASLVQTTSVRRLKQALGRGHFCEPATHARSVAGVLSWRHFLALQRLSGRTCSPSRW